MRIAAYLHHLDPAGRLTGVGRHMVNMTRGLAQTPGVDLQTLTYKKFLVNGQYPADSPYAGLPATGLPLSPAYLHRMWVILGQPTLDRWRPDAQWLYCPLEIYVPTRKVPVAITVHDLHAFETDLPWSHTAQHQRFASQWRMKFGPILLHTRMFATVSEFTRGRMVRFLGIPEEKIVVVGNGVDEAFFAAAEGTEKRFKIQDSRFKIEGEGSAGISSEEGRPYVVVIGGLTLRKSGAEVLAFARALHQRGKDLRVLVAGASDAKLEEQSKSVPNVVRLGYVPDVDLPGLVRGAVALLHLSRYEGFGIPAAEAMAAGTPAIVSAFAALPAVVGDAGIIVDISKPAAIADIVMNLARNQPLRQRYQDLGRQRARQFHWASCVERLLAGLRERT